jgi:DsbC/DsbD-like thiol-disulfide interchange protein
MLLIAIVTGCYSRMAPHTKETDAPFASSKPSSSEPVTAAMKSAPPEVMAGETFEILVRVEIAGAHHIYASNVVGKPFIPTTLDVTLPRGVEALGNWIGPEPTRRRSGELVYIDSALFHRPLRVRANVPAGPLSIKGELHYQTCTEELCWPPRTIQLSSSISVQSPRR